ncbi:MAG: hypothetical protein Tp1111SUR761211_6 [Prokaryotic dsDNA virus sp.]|nr:MAG: hypothetical protein Tp1111SUR761211_6 [Prokaryotic dsDNA virus sp.]|tara:strand:- start:5408 stop:5623 length:216 start_codon:yes stop_codon:yes gene_type:complete
MANNINWGKVYCEMVTNSTWGTDSAFTTEFIPDISAPSCWGTFPITADLTQISGTPFLADTTLYRADATQK